MDFDLARYCEAALPNEQLDNLEIDREFELFKVITDPPTFSFYHKDFMHFNCLWEFVKIPTI